KSARGWSVRLEPIPPFTWTDPEAAMGTIDPLTSVGFEPAGWYLQPTGRQPNRWPRLQGFFHTEAAAYAAVFEMPSHDVELDLYCLYQNGTSMTYTMEGRVPGFEYWSSHSIHRMPA